LTVLPLAAFTWLVGSACGSANEGDSPDAEGGNGGRAGEDSVASAGTGNSSNGGTPNSGGVGGTEPAAGAGGQGGQGGAPIVLGPPEVDLVTPEVGPYGTLITITGSFLGRSTRAGVQLRIGAQPAFVIYADDEGFVESWTEDEIRFFYPFPAEGEIELETPQGVAVVGEFESSWLTQVTATNAPAASVIASISTAPQTVTMLFDTTPPVLLELGPDGAVSNEVTLGGALKDSVRLYLAGDTIEGIGVTDGATPELVDLRNVDGDLVGELTGILLDATETALAGGPDGACAWLNQDDGWRVARPGVDGEWALADGPFVEEDINLADRAVGASSDGSLYVAWSVDAGNFFDDMQAPRMKRFDPSTLTWGGSQSAGSGVDDYITSLEILDKGRGIVVRYCGSDTDPFNLSGTAYRCYDGLHTPSGASIAKVSVDVTASRHAFSAARAVAGHCGSGTFRLRTDTDVAAEPNGPIGEPIVYPCQTSVALEVDPDGDFVPIVRRGTTLHLLGRREAPVPAP
jgi:hypothetical protein